MRTHNIPSCPKENRKDIHIMPPSLALRLKLISSNYPCIEHILMVPNVFEALKFYCIQLQIQKLAAIQHNNKS